MKSISLKKHSLLSILAIALMVPACSFAVNSSADVGKSHDSSNIQPPEVNSTLGITTTAEVSGDDVSGGSQGGSFNTTKGCPASYTGRVELTIQGVGHDGCGDGWWNDNDAPDRFQLNATVSSCTPQSCSVSYSAPKGCVTGDDGQNFSGIHFSYVLYCVPNHQ